MSEFDQDRTRVQARVESAASRLRAALDRCREFGAAEPVPTEWADRAAELGDATEFAPRSWDMVSKYLGGLIIRHGRENDPTPVTLSTNREDGHITYRADVVLIPRAEFAALKRLVHEIETVQRPRERASG